MANTTNFGWETPDDTDLVKDGAAAMRTLGNAIDASFVDLKGGTTNQVLAKNSNTDLDFKWVADATGIPATIFDAKGDIIAATAADTADRLAVGANNTVLTADSSTATGLKWATPTTTPNSWSLINTGGTALTGATTITVTGISGKNEIYVRVENASSANASSFIRIQFNTDTGTNYNYQGNYGIYNTTYSKDDFGGIYGTNDNYFNLARMGNNSSSAASGALYMTGANTSGIKIIQLNGGADSGGGEGHRIYNLMGFWNNSATVTSVSIVSSTGNFDSGTVYVYGA